MRSSTGKRLWPAFAVLGFVGSLGVADFAGGPDIVAGDLILEPRVKLTTLVFLMALAPLLAALAGWLVERAGGIVPRESVRLLISTMIGGAVLGATAFAFFDRHTGFPGRQLADGVAGGVVFAIPFYIAFTVVLWTWRRIGRARSGSVVDGVLRRALWRQTAAIAAVAAALIVPRHGHAFVSLATLVALLVIAVALVVNAAAFVRVARVKLDGFRPRSDGETANVRLDLGLGDIVHERVIDGTLPYRGGQNVVDTVAGDPALARTAIARVLVADAVALATVAGLVWFWSRVTTCG